VQPPIEGEEPIVETIGARTLGASEVAVEIAPTPADTERMEIQTVIKIHDSPVNGNKLTPIL
jgi:hypothetical protein